MEKVNERDPARRDRFLRVVAVCAEKVTIIAGRDLSFHARNRKLLDPKLVQYSWQHPSNSLQDYSLMLSQIREHPRAPMVVIDHTLSASGRDYLAALELGLMLKRVGH